MEQAHAVQTRNACPPGFGKGSSRNADSAAELPVAVQQESRRGAVRVKFECYDSTAISCEEVCVVDWEYLRFHMPGRLYYDAVLPWRYGDHKLRR